MKENKAKRVLILSNECLSRATSNGRTLANFLVGYPKECIAQFSVQSVQPDFELCGRYFCVTDREALHACLKGKRVGRRVVPAADGTSKSTAPRSMERNAWTMLMRDLVWSTGRWQKGAFTEFVEEFKPEVLLLQAGDCAFMLRLAGKLAKKYNIPLVIYNTEGYYFKKHDYFRGKGFAHLIYPIFRRRFVKAFSKTVKKASYIIYNCEALRRDYETVFNVPSQVLYTATQMQPRKAHPANQPPRIAYLGKMEVGRHWGLIKIADMLARIDPELHLDVYGKVTCKEWEDEMKACKNLTLHGLVSYDEVKRIMCESDILVHAECFGDFYRIDSKYAFSTKIADTLACGTCFFFFAPKEFACTRYLSENEAAFVATEDSEAEALLKILIEQPEKRDLYFENAQRLVAQNHQAEANAAKFAEILNTVSV